jgi:hypothetical protein
MRKAKLHELNLPSRYALWHKYIHGTDLQSQVSPERFTNLLTQRQAIELVNWKGSIKCKTLNEMLIKKALEDLSNEPLRSWFSVWFYRLAKRQATSRPTNGTPEPTR